MTAPRTNTVWRHPAFSLAATLLALVTLIGTSVGAQAAPASGSFPCTKGGTCFVWLHGIITFKEVAHYTEGGNMTTDTNESLTVVVGLTRRADGLPSAQYSDNLSTKTVVKAGGICTVDLVSGKGIGKGHIEFGYGLENHPWYWDKDYHFVFVPDVGFPATEKSAVGDTCSASAPAEADYPKPTGAIFQFVMPAHLTNPLTLQGKMITLGKVQNDTEGQGTCAMPDGAKGSDVCTTIWKLTAQFSPKGQPGA